MAFNHSSHGLTQEEAQRRLALDGPNELPSQRPRGFLHIVGDVLVEPMFLLLLAAATIYLILGDRREAMVLACSVLVVIAITVLQERRTEHALARLKDLSSPRALVIRDGVEQRIAGRDVVVGDIVLLREGDRVPADGIVSSANALSIDESILTGESLPVDKAISAEGGAISQVYSGTLVLRGFGTAQVTAIGARSEIGKIGQALTSLSSETTPLFREVRRVVRWVAVAGMLLCALIAVAYGAARNDWLGGVLAGITVAMGVLPEEFPVVLTVFLAMGAWRISRTGVLTRRMPAIESMGSVTLLAVDKTGTLTENRMRVALLDSLGLRIDLRQAEPELDDAARSVLLIATAASERLPFDPMERAIHDCARQHLPQLSAALETQELVREYDLTPELLAVTHVWRGAHGLEVAVKGAPETVLELCRIHPDERAALMQRIADYTQQGLRVLGVAEGIHGDESLPDSPRDFELRLLGFICLADPLRQDVPVALTECQQAGIRVVMITGDHPGTALAIAAQAGFATDGGVITGAELAAMDDYALQQRTRMVNIYARFKPEHKLRLVEAFKASGEIVAMTGDGVNDAPALKAAHVGVAMGGRGTDVAREAASLVLVHDDFSSLVAAVRLGRRIYDNIRHAMSYIVAVHIPIAGLGLAPILFGWPLLFFPMHVLFLEFVIDPACAFVFEADAEAPDAMRRPPRRPDQPLFSTGMLRRSLLLGAAILILVVMIYHVALAWMNEPSARALTFVALVIANLALIFVSRSHRANLAAIYARPNSIYWWMAVIVCVALALVLYVPALALAFKFAAPGPNAIVVVAILATLVVLAAGGLARRMAVTA